MKTFTYRSLSSNPGPLQDFVAGVFNNDSLGGGVIQVHQVLLSPISGQSVSAIARYTLVRITATTGGTAVPAAKHDPGAPSLPAQVVFSMLPSDTTRTDIYAYRADVQMLPPTPNTAQLFLPITQRFGGGPRTTPLDCGRLFNARYNDAIEGIVLRPGEGLAMCLVDFGYAHPTPISIQVTNKATGATYTYTTTATFPRIKDECFWSLMNGTGSGVTLEVKIVDTPVHGSCQLPQLRLCRVGGIPPGLSTRAPVAHDTLNAVPPWVVCGQGPAIADLWGRNQGLPLTWEMDSGAQISIALQQRAGRFRNRTYPNWSADADSPLPPPCGTLAASVMYSDCRGRAPIVLGPGQGLAVLTGREGIIEDSTFDYWIVEITFSVQDHQRLSLPGAVYVA